MKRIVQTLVLYPFLGLAVISAMGCASMGTATTQKWSWTSPYMAGAADMGGGAFSKNTMVLTADSPTAQKGSMKIVGYFTETCMVGSLDVAIERTPTELVLVPEKRLATCPDVRITIRKDGTGGKVEMKAYKANSFAVYREADGYDYGLIPR